MAWLFLIVASVFEVGWVLSLKLSDGFTKWIPMITYALCGIGAAFFLSRASRTIPMATAYTVWVGMTMVGTAIVDAGIFKQSMSWERILCLALIVLGTGGLKWFSPTTG